MRDPMLAPFCRAEYDAQQIMTSHPPRWAHPNKQLVASISCPPGCHHAGQIGFTRWKARPLPVEINAQEFGTTLELQSGFFRYQPPVAPPATVDWYLNFADPHLFGFYAGRLFAQDEMQVTEHPALAALRDAVQADGLLPLTVENQVPTPILVTGVERRCSVATDPNPAYGRPYGLYGNRFGSENPDAIRQATTAIVPATVSNILAMAALPPSRGNYTQSQIEYILRTAITGFSAACIESERSNPDVKVVRIFTGHWGCGAFGGNRELTALLQLLAANISGVHKLVFCYGDDAGLPAVQAAQRQLQILVTQTTKLDDLIKLIAAQRYQWGISDGN